MGKFNIPGTFTSIREPMRQLPSLRIGIGGLAGIDEALANKSRLEYGGRTGCWTIGCDRRLMIFRREIR
jgi:hypothetical protein